MRLLSSLLLGLLLVSVAPVHAQEQTPEAGSIFTNPVLDQDFPDPDVLRIGDTYYAYSTNVENTNIQVARSTALVHWQMMGDALPRLPNWAVQASGWAWAPDVSSNGNTYLMYFVARYGVGKGGTQCIGTATSDTPEGPFQPAGDAPLICQVKEGGSIDPASFVDTDGMHYILWKNDGNSSGGQTRIYLQPTSDDGLKLAGEPIRLITSDQSWEGILVEGPTLWKHGDEYVLFYSANAYDSPNYGVGYAVAESIDGPYKKPGKPLLKTSIREGVVGPGGQDVVLDEGGKTWMLFHAWRGGGYRALNLVQLDWNGDVPAANPTRAPMAAPHTTP
jgi:arabinan endo-1,5-alpha-L-arabinosidase